MERMAVISAHSADWCTRSGGTIIKYAEMGWDVTVIILTYGIRGESRQFWEDNPGGPPERCRQIRIDEIRNVSECMGVAVECLDYDDYPLTMDEGRIRKLTERLLELRPGIVLTHWVEDSLNPDHATAAGAVIKAVSAAARLGAFPDTAALPFPGVFFFESTLPNSQFNKFDINVYIDIGDVYEKKINAIRHFAAQPELVSIYQNCAAQRGREASDWLRMPGRKIAYAEAFHRYLPYLGKTFPLTDRVSLGDTIHGL
jgi:4-oxalomesaconate hydratase